MNRIRIKLQEYIFFVEIKSILNALIQSSERFGIIIYAGASNRLKSAYGFGVRIKEKGPCHEFTVSSFKRIHDVSRLGMRIYIYILSPCFSQRKKKKKKVLTRFRGKRSFLHARSKHRQRKYGRSTDRRPT